MNPVVRATTIVLLLVLSRLTPALAANGSLKVTSFPSGAEVWVDGVNSGKVTPMSMSLSEGDHTVTVRLPGSGWSPDTRTVTIVPGNNDLSVTLLPALTTGSTGPAGAAATVRPAAPTECAAGGVVVTSGDGGVSLPVCNGTNGMATRAAGPCFYNYSRYVDCGNGTVTDTVTGLIWLKQADCVRFLTWAEANQAVATLKNGDCSLSDGSSPGDWRLPTKGEWEATIAEAVARGCTIPGLHPPSLTDLSGASCYLDGSKSPFVGVRRGGIYWSSSTWDAHPELAWQADLEFGEVRALQRDLEGLGWAVRDGR